MKIKTLAILIFLGYLVTLAAPTVMGGSYLASRHQEKFEEVLSACN